MKGELGFRFAIAIFILFMLMIFMMPSISGPNYLPSFMSQKYVGYAFGIACFIVIVIMFKYVMR